MTLEGTIQDESYIGDSYLGDGLTATFNGWQITLSTPRENGTHWLALEPETFRNLMRFAESINAKYRVQHFATRDAVMRGSLE